MKREEAIKLLNDIHSQCCDTANILCTLDADKRCDALQMAITALQNYPVWIPVSERLPEESLNSVIGWDTYRKRCCFVQYLGGRFVLGDDIDSVNVTAWMPLPEPYRESEPHKQTNADRIRSMTDKELAEMLSVVSQHCVVYLSDHIDCRHSRCESSCKSNIKKWLQKESEE